MSLAASTFKRRVGKYGGSFLFRSPNIIDQGKGRDHASIQLHSKDTVLQRLDHGSHFWILKNLFDSITSTKVNVESALILKQIYSCVRVLSPSFIEGIIKITTVFKRFPFVMGKDFN